jgi:hypothetical protein
MRFARLAALLCLGALGCAQSAVSLDGYGGVYTTHFDGVPDTSRVCALLSNRGERAVDWVRLRLRTFSDYEGVHTRLSSSWVYAFPLAPGETIAVELIDPPVSPEIELRLRDAGHGRLPPGRMVRASTQCGEQRLLESTLRRMESRTADGIEVHTLRRRGARGDALLAGD